MAKMKEITCKCGCGRKKMVRCADIRRGWGKYYSKSCKAIDQTRRKGYNYPKEQKDNWEEYIDSLHPFSSEALGQWED